MGSGWQEIDRIWTVGNEFLYGRSANGGDLSLWRHHGILTGHASWTADVKVGAG